MVDFIVNGIFWVLALYGLFEIIKQIIYIYTYTDLKSEGIYVIVAIKNQENKVEGFLRTILFRLIYGKEDNVKNIIVADLGSTDETMNIVNKLSKEYECIKTIKWKECKEIIDTINDAK